MDIVSSDTTRSFLEVKSTVYSAPEPEQVSYKRKQKGEYLKLSPRAQRKLAQAVQQANQCLIGSNKATKSTGGVEKLKIVLARILRDSAICSCDSSQIWVNLDSRSGIHVYIFQVKRLTKKAFEHPHIHYFAEADGRLQICHGFRKTKWNTGQFALADK